MSDEQQSQSEEPKTPGQILRAARELRGYSQSGVAERLCLSIQTIKDIENDDYKHFTAEIYLRGHMRSYARLCNVDPAIVLKAYEDLGIDIESDSQVPVMLVQDVSASRRTHRTKRKTLLWASLGVLLVLIIMVVLWWQEQQRHIYYSEKGASANKHAVSIPLSSEAMTEPVKPPASNNVQKRPAMKKKKLKFAKTTTTVKTVHASARRHHRVKALVPDYSISPAN